MRSEGLPFIVGGLGVGPVFASRGLTRRRVVANLSTLGEALEMDLDGSMTCQIRVK